MSENLGFPFQIAGDGRPRRVDRRTTLSHQLEQLLFTLPGERVNRPEFGCGVQRLVFEGASIEATASAEYLISTSIRRHLGDLLSLEAVRVSTDDTTLYIDILYTRLETATEEAASFQRPLGVNP